MPRSTHSPCLSLLAQLRVARVKGDLGALRSLMRELRESTAMTAPRSRALRRVQRPHFER